MSMKHSNIRGFSCNFSSDKITIDEYYECGCVCHKSQIYSFPVSEHWDKTKCTKITKPVK